VWIMITISGRGGGGGGGKAGAAAHAQGRLKQQRPLQRVRALWEGVWRSKGPPECTIWA